MDEFKKLKQRLIDSLIRNFQKKGENITYTEFKPIDEDYVIDVLGYRPENIKKRDKRNKNNFKGFIRRKFK